MQKVHLGKPHDTKMSDIKINTFFVSEKVNKVRWIPEQLKESQRFLTGSWEMDKNFVRVWKLQQNRYPDDYNEFVPHCCDKLEFAGDVTGMELISSDIAAVSSADGHVSAIKVNKAVEEDQIEMIDRSTMLHEFTTSGKAAPCTAISIYGKDIATVGEDGRLNIVNVNNLKIVHRTILADSCSLMAVLYVSPQEVLTANRMGVIRMFDVRASADSTKPTNSFMTSCLDDKNSNFVSCLASHPTQSHVVLAGSEEGSITVWDLRQPGYPASYIGAHTSAITEINFHHSDPTKVFTAAEAGELWLWTQHPTLNMTHTGLETPAVETINPWLSGERTKSRISVTSLISDLRKSINSFDSHGSKIVCSSDSEAIYFIDNIL